VRAVPQPRHEPRLGGLDERTPRHTFANPHGFEFRIACFADAPGCLEVGEESAYRPRLPGFTWQVTLCRQCGEHLGWLFRSPGARFFGLILDRLV
jgi:hypothetical protein